jgi:sec-independent protein translocase protein TatA
MTVTPTLAFVGGVPGGGEVLLVLVALLVLFGAKNLPQIARTIGKTLEEFRRATREVTDEIMRAEPPPSSEDKASLPPPPNGTSPRSPEGEPYTDADNGPGPREG